MHPILFQWRGVSVWSYPAFLYLGLCAGMFAGNAAAHAAGTEAFGVFVATLLLIPIAVAGSRILYVTAHWSCYRRNLARIWNRQEGGMSLYGGILLALAASAPLLRFLHVGMGAFWDASVFTILVGMIPTRVGCLLNGCCSGRKTETWLGLYLPNHQGVWARRIPTQCLEALWAAMLLAIAITVRGWMRWPGALFLFAAGGYALGRIGLELTREREPGAPPFTVEHAISVAALVASFVILGLRLAR